LAEVAKVALDPAAAADHDVVGAGVALFRKDFAGKGAEAALHAIAHDGAADLPAHREADTTKRIAIVTIVNEEHKAGCRRTPTGVRSEEIRPFPKGD
jgi:hypothetical protein